ncbi:MAG: response regulator transcription factor [Lachnospiraceae bacterium]|nr:response regulator transcription factor [Lachnospiraceae bacterium]
MADILIVEDNKELAGLLADFLCANNYSVCIAGDGNKALELYNEKGAKLVLLDIMLPGTDGFAVCKKIREEGNTPVIIISAKNDKQSELDGLNLGADDYIGKPYDIDILLAKISGIFKRRYAADNIICGNISLNKTGRTAERDGVPLALSAKEFDLLCLLMENRGRVLGKEYIFNKIWGSGSFSEPQTLTVHIKWLRQKIEDNPGKPEKIVTIWGMGYKFI